MKLKSTLLRGLAIGFALVGVAGVTVAAQSPLPGKKSEKKHIPYRITRGDVLSVEVLASGEREFAAVGKRVEATGTINLLYIQEIRLVGLTIAEAASFAIPS